MSNPTFEFEIRFTRYGNGVRQQSYPAWVMAKSFSDAHQMAQLLLRGMTSADASREYGIAFISQRGLSGPTHQGPKLWPSDADA